MAAVAVADTVRDGPLSVGPDGASKTWSRGGACTTALVTPAPGIPAGASTGPSAAASFFLRYVLLGQGRGLAWGQLGCGQCEGAWGPQPLAWQPAGLPGEICGLALPAVEQKGSSQPSFRPSGLSGSHIHGSVSGGLSPWGWGTAKDRVRTLPLRAVQTWASHVTSLCLSFLRGAAS